MLGTLGMPSYAHTSDTINFRKLSCLSAGKKSASPPLFSGDIAMLCKLLLLCTFGYIHP